MKFSDLRRTRIVPGAGAHLAAIDRALEDLVSHFGNESSGRLKRYHSYHRNRLAADLAGMPGTGHILEIGANPWLLTVAMRKAGLDVAAVDFEAAEVPGIPTYGCNIETGPLPFEDGSFDLVLFNEVFEHLHTDLVFALENILRVLKPGGVLHLSTPNMRSLRGLKALLVDGRGAWCLPDLHENWQHVPGPVGHVREYTPRDVADFLEATGFDCREIRFRGGGGTAAGRWLLRAAPAWSPYFSIVARKP